MLKGLLKSFMDFSKTLHPKDKNMPNVFSKYMSDDDFNYLIKQTKLNTSDKKCIY